LTLPGLPALEEVILAQHGRVARHVDQRLTPASVAEAKGHEVIHALLAHVAERHRRPGRVPRKTVHKDRR
jgi:uncharacterized protein YlaN (UPF0358 family)